MGVQGLTPFLQKICPGLLKTLPNRLQEIQGKRIVIDATLITQRLHFSQAYSVFPHVLGWYRIAKELNDNGISAICVFDGESRNRAKAREVKRRSELRDLTATRGSIESDRLQRLNKLKTVAEHFQGFDTDGKRFVAERLSLSQEGGAPQQENLPLASDQDSVPPLQEQEPPKQELPLLKIPPKPPLQDLPLAGDQVSTPPLQEQELPKQESPLQEIPPLKPPLQDLPLAGDQDSTPLLQEQEPPLLEIPPLKPPLPTYSSPPTADPPLSLDQTLRTFESLSLDFKANVAKLASVTPSEPLPSSTDEEEDKVNCVMTKAQNQLTTDEGKLWGKIASSMSMHAKPSVSSTAPLDFSISTIDDIHALADKSLVMTTSFLRRTQTATSKTYKESKEILQAMGIACIDATDATEAEALASAIVHEGLADFVATEDTDVLVYEVPMMRNITNRVDPLIIVSGAEVRAELDLDRDAFIDFALLLGTDFSQRISNLGPKRAYKFIKDHGSIERIIELEPKYVPKGSREDYLAEVELGRLIYKTLPTVPLSQLKKKIKKKRDDRKVISLLRRHGLFREVGDINPGDWESLLDGNYFSDSPTA